MFFTDNQNPEKNQARWQFVHWIRKEPFDTIPTKITNGDRDYYPTGLYASWYYDPFRGRDIRFKLFADFVNMGCALSEIESFLVWGMVRYPHLFDNVSKSRKHVRDMVLDFEHAMRTKDLTRVRAYFVKKTFDMRRNDTNERLGDDEIIVILRQLNHEVTSPRLPAAAAAAAFIPLPPVESPPVATPPELQGVEENYIVTDVPSNREVKRKKLTVFGRNPALLASVVQRHEQQDNFKRAAAAAGYSMEDIEEIERQDRIKRIRDAGWGDLID